MKTIVINGATFEVIKPRKNKPDFQRAQVYNGIGLYKYYNRPSHIKELIWAEWLNWSKEVQGLETFGVSGGNCMTFSITGTYYDEHGNKWVMYITASHKRLILAE